jgi:hypothetical protein
VTFTKAVAKKLAAKGGTLKVSAATSGSGLAAATRSVVLHAPRKH